jgi:EmrB/QacA subfamily drug resistance transporter
MFADDRRLKLITLGTLCFTLFMAMLDNTVVNLALPTIQRKLGASVSGLQWIVDAYILFIAALLLTGGTLGDMYGRRKAFIGGLGLFTLGSLLCALAPNLSMLIAARCFQGVGGAVMMPSTLSILTNTFRDPRERAQAIGIWAGVSGLALAVGPLVGGAMVDTFGWQSIFLINLPVGVLAIVLAWLFVPESADREGRSLDLPGQALAIVGLASLTYAFIEANKYGWTSATIISLFVVAVVALTAFVAVEARTTNPMVQLSFFRNRTFSGANMVGLIVSFGFFGIIFFLSLFFQSVQGYSAVRAGVLTLPMTLGVMVLAIVSGRITGAIGARVPVAVGMFLLGGALLGFTIVAPTTPYSQLWYFLLLMGAGMGLVMSPITTAIMSTVPTARAGMASATSNTMRQVGGVFGIAVLGSVVTNRYASSLKASLAPLHLPKQEVQQILQMASQGRESAGGKAPSPEILRIIGNSFTSGFHLGLWISGLLLLVGVPVAWFTIHDTSADAQHARRRARDAAAVKAEAAATAAETAGPAAEALPAEE